jgi:hypothetical protein
MQQGHIRLVAVIINGYRDFIRDAMSIQVPTLRAINYQLPIISKSPLFFQKTIPQPTKHILYPFTLIVLQ